VTTTLLDASVLIPLTISDHSFHAPAVKWFAARSEAFATTPITQGSLLRFALRGGATRSDALALVTGLCGHPKHRFWTDDLAFEEVDLGGVIGHRQVTDAYLAAQSRARKGRIATFDSGLAALHPDVADLIPS
jgi:toxin-antitoxin system PIN domain toxin